MAGTDYVFNIAKGKVARYAELPAANDALKCCLLVSSGLEADATAKDYDTLALLLAGTTDEMTTSGTNYVRKTLASVTVTPDDTNDRLDVDCADITWTALTTGFTVAKLVIYYDPDTTASSDANNIPLTAHSFDVSTDGTDVTATVSNFFRAS